MVETSLARCPECGSNRLYKDGLRYLSNGKAVQRFSCRGCGFRFSEPKIKVDVSAKPLELLNPGPDLAEKVIREGDLTLKELVDSGSFFSCEDIRAHDSKPRITVTGKELNNFLSYDSKRQVCALNKKAKNLDTATEIKTVAGEPQNKEAKGLVTQFMAWLDKEGYTKGSRYPNNLTTLVNLGADLLNPESVKTVLGKHNIKNGAKLQHVYAYSAFAKMLKITWEAPKYRQEETLPFIPDEKELDQLIAACRSKRMTAYLQCLKETFADPGEALKLRWIDVSGNVITINKTVKGHLPRQLQVSNKLLSMLNSLPKTSERIFPTTYNSLFCCFNRVRKRAAELQKNPRLLSIELRTFRHWGGTMIAHYTNGNVLTVKKLLGHKRIENTMKYISMIHFKDDEFEVTTATTVEEAKQVLSAGFDYVAEKNGIMLFRRPKRFSAYVS